MRCQRVDQPGGNLVELIRMRCRALAQPCAYALCTTSDRCAPHPHFRELPLAVRLFTTKGLPERAARHTGAATGFVRLSPIGDRSIRTEPSADAAGHRPQQLQQWP
ncbi:hypothetical protein ACIBCS_41270 [Streptomyces phaeochromogenes]|uniref:hypothetical protein n=1 Tax=Streptomyces phaeochromogenes TaxID=1923 RepID=UPI0037B0ED0A